MVYLSRSSEEQPPTLMGPDLRGLGGMSRWHWEQLGGALGRELQTDGGFRSSREKNPFSPSTPEDDDPGRKTCSYPILLPLLPELC